MRLPPFAIIAQWPKANYVDPKTHGPASLIVNIIFTIIMVIAAAGRFYARLAIKRKPGVDDLLCAIALVFALGTTAVVLLANDRYGWSRHIWDLPFTMIEKANIIAFVAKITFTLAATFTRLSLISFYYRLVRDSGIIWFNRVLHLSLAWTIAVGVTFMCLAIWLCNPVEAYWVFPPTENGHCLNEGKVLLAAGVVNSFSDLLVTVLPIPIVMRLHMPLRQRAGVCFLLSLGMVVTIAGALRTYFTWKSLLASWDETWYAYPLWICAAVEIDLGLICSCAPAWKTLLASPLKNLSSKISSLRTPSDAPTCTTDDSGPSFLRPFRNLPVFHRTKLPFERSRPGEYYTLEDVDKVDQKASGQVHLTGPPIALVKGKGSTEVLVKEEECPRSSTPALEIEMRRSFDQRSARLEERSLTAEGCVANGGSKSVSPRR